MDLSAQWQGHYLEVCLVFFQRQTQSLPGNNQPHIFIQSFGKRNSVRFLAVLIKCLLLHKRALPAFHRHYLWLPALLSFQSPPWDGENVPSILAMKCCWVCSGGCVGVANSIKETGSGNTWSEIWFVLWQNRISVLGLALGRSQKRLSRAERIPHLPED